MNNQTRIYFIDRSSKSGPVNFGRQELLDSLKQAGADIENINYWTEADKDSICIVMGECSNRLVEKLLSHSGVEVSGGAEGAIFQWCDTGNEKVLVVSGTDEKGLMYALTELAERVRCRGAGILAQVENLQEYPFNKVRGVDRFIMGHRDDDWFYSEDFWQYFLKRLARCRFNRFTLITGFDTAYMTPPYPFFVDVPGFPDVAVKDMAPGKREKNLEMLRLIGRLCKNLGLEFFFSTWQQLPWTENQKFLVENIPAGDEEFTKYCAGGIKRIILECPDISGIQFRVNLEAGIRGSKDDSSTHVRFWYEMVDSIVAAGRPVKLDLRAKGLTDSMLEYALNCGLDVAVPTKYWCEHAALPYHIPQLRTEEMARLGNLNSNRRYSYDNLLKKPHWYDMIYRLWSYGSINLFLWGDPDYCRRFSESCGMGEGAGFTVNSPLSLKGGHELIPGEAWPVHINPDIIDYKWEDERYWMYYLAFGRLGYNLNTGEDVWKREFEKRFGGEISTYIEAAYGWASKIMPLITTAHFPVHPSLHYWPELYTGAALFHENNYDPYFKKFDYANSLPSDEALFYSIEQYMDDKLSGRLKGKYNPLQVRDWLKAMADNTRASLNKAAEVLNNAGDAGKAGIAAMAEYKAAFVDFTMLADIAEFHVWKIKAAYHLYLFRKSGMREELETSYQAMLAARSFWEELSKIGDENYNHNLEFNAGTGRKRNGNWRNRLTGEIDLDIKCLVKLLEENGADRVKAEKSASYEFKSMLEPGGLAAVSLKAEVPERCPAGQDLVVYLKTDGLSINGRIDRFYLNYRHTDHTKGGYLCIEMEKTGSGYRGIVPGDYILPQWDLIVFFSATDKAGNALIYPGVYHAEYSAPYFTIKVVG